MNIKRITMVKPPLKHLYRGKSYVQMTDPVSNQALTEHDAITLKDLEKIDILIVETKPHANYGHEKKKLFRSQKFYYRMV